MSAFHDFWKNEVAERKDVVTAPTAWSAMLAAYDLQTFSPLDAIIPFVFHYHEFFETKVSSKKIRDVFAILRRLGLTRLGSFRRLPAADIQKRFGKAWADLFYGLQYPEQATWVWRPYRPDTEISWAHDFDFAASDSTPISQALQIYFEKLAKQSPNLHIQKFHLTLVLFDSTDDVSIEIVNAHPYIMSRDLLWILRIFDERLQHLTLPSYVSRLLLKIIPAPPSPQIQLGLFEDKAKAMAWNSFCKKMMNEGFKVFQPEILPAYAPEDMWRPGSPLEAPKLPAQGMIRPLIQESPQNISEPSGPLWFTERLAWFDEQGNPCGRDYFIARSETKYEHAWIWVFQNEKGQWYRQGIIE